MYENENLKINLNYFLNTNMIKFIQDIDKIISEIIGILSRYKINKIIEKNNNFLDNLLSAFNELDIFVIKLYTMITDIYFLRRILDKNYIKNIITYCGRYHAFNYIYFLIKFCDFKIIKIYDSHDLTINDIIEKFKEIEYIQEIYILFKLEKPKQCVPNIPMDEIMLKYWL